MNSVTASERASKLRCHFTPQRPELQEAAQRHGLSCPVWVQLSRSSHPVVRPAKGAVVVEAVCRRSMTFVHVSAFKPHPSINSLPPVAIPHCVETGRPFPPIAAAILSYQSAFLPSRSQWWCGRTASTLERRTFDRGAVATTAAVDGESLVLHKELRSAAVASTRATPSHATAACDMQPQSTAWNDSESTWPVDGSAPLPRSCAGLEHMTPPPAPNAGFGSHRADYGGRVPETFTGKFVNLTQCCPGVQRAVWQRGISGDTGRQFGPEHRWQYKVPRERLLPGTQLTADPSDMSAYANGWQVGLAGALTSPLLFSIPTLAKYDLHLRHDATPVRTTGQSLLLPVEDFDNADDIIAAFRSNCTQAAAADCARPRDVVTGQHIRALPLVSRLADATKAASNLFVPSAAITFGIPAHPGSRGRCLLSDSRKLLSMLRQHPRHAADPVAVRGAFEASMGSFRAGPVVFPQRRALAQPSFVGFGVPTPLPLFSVDALMNPDWGYTVAGVPQDPFSDVPGSALLATSERAKP